MGCFWDSFAVLLPDLKARLVIGDGTLGLILLGAAAGALVAMWLSPRVDAALPRWFIPLILLPRLRRLAPA